MLPRALAWWPHTITLAGSVVFTLAHVACARQVTYAVPKTASLLDHIKISIFEDIKSNFALPSHVGMWETYD